MGTKKTLTIPSSVSDRSILQGFVSATLQEAAVKFPAAWKDYMEMYRACLTPDEKLTMKIETGWFMYLMGFHEGRINMATIAQGQNLALSELVARCDGEQGVRADGSNIDTLHAHAALGDFENKEEKQ